MKRKTYEEQRQVLHSPFSIEMHKETFINYLEVIMRYDGTIEYAVPSHQEKLLRIAMDQFSVTREQLDAMCPVDFYGEFNLWLTIITGSIAIYSKGMTGIVNATQRARLEELAEHGLFLGRIIELEDVLYEPAVEYYKVVEENRQDMHERVKRMEGTRP